MANLTRPSLRPSTERRTRHAKPPATDDIENNTQHHISISTRRSSRTTPLLAHGDDIIAPKIASKALARPAVLARSSSRKRPATALLADAPPDTRPPTRVTVTQPHGRLLSITNGVSQILPIADDDVPSGVSTPRTDVTANTLAGPAQAGGTKGQDKRSLRSHDGGSRLKSDLAIYFSNYDDIIAGVPKPPEFLEPETPIYIVDEPSKTTKASNTAPEPLRQSASPSRSRKPRAHSPLRRISNASIPALQSSSSFPTIDYTTVMPHVRNDVEGDPLPDSMYYAQHRRAERKEKQLRNIEKERAMHEKVQLERLLDGLQGHDWLKVMGITGVTDGERKDWEPKRNYFVKEVETLVDKFRMWKEEEKRLRAEKEAALAAQEEEDEDGDDVDDEEEEEEEEPSDLDSSKTEPSSSERRRREPQVPKPRRLRQPHGYILPILAPEPRTPFTSFYAKPHLRTAALGKHRHGRNATAFGLPIPDFVEHEFLPPVELLTVEALRDHARKRRRQKRESGVQT